MPKNSKKKKERAADFTKAKLKLGKGKKLPSNAVDTSFKARRIALPTQSITVQKDDIPTTKKKRTFDDILSLLKHYSVDARKDAISSARELFEDFPYLMSSSMAALFGACARLIGDEDASVRKTLLSFFEWLLPRVPKDDLVPHVPLLLLFTTSAQTHIFPEIRIDAVRYVDLFLEILPEHVVAGWNENRSGVGNRILDGYLGLLNSGTKFGASGGAHDAHAMATSSVMLSPQSKLIVLRSLSNFLSHAVRPQLAANAPATDPSSAAPALPTWFLRPFFANTRLFEEHVDVFRAPGAERQGRQVYWVPQPTSESFDEDFVYPCDTVPAPAPPWSLAELSDISADQDQSSDPLDENSFLMRLGRTFLSTLTASYLDCAPVVFSPSVNPPDTDLQLLMAGLELTRTLYGTVLQGTNLGPNVVTCRDELRVLLGYLAGYFPFNPARRDAKVEQAFQSLNVMYCELSTLLLLVSTSAVPEAGQPGDTQSQSFNQKSRLACARVSTKLQIQTDPVCTYVVRLLSGEGETSAQLLRPLTPSVYAALLPSIWMLLNHVTLSSAQCDRGARSSVLSATLDQAVRTTSSSAVKRLTVEFVARLLLLEKNRGYVGSFNPRGAAVDEKWQQWILHLPKVLWELGANCLSASETIMRALLRLIQCGSFAVRREHIASLCSRLTPFFTVKHPTRGRIPGPFAKIPASASHIRRLSLDLSATLIADQIRLEISDGTVGRELRKAVQTAVVATAEEEYWARLTGSTRQR